MAFGIGDLLSKQAILLDENPNSKKQLFQILSKKASELCGLDERLIFSTLLQRERLGSTGVGNGIAIPHGKLADLEAITAVFARLIKPVSYDALDDQPVDIVFLLLAPESAGADHLKALSRVARRLRSRELVDEIRNGDDLSTVHFLLTRDPARNAA